MHAIKSFLAAAVLLIAGAAQAQGIATAARHAILVEMETGDVLYSKDAATQFPPASMAKMMTVYLMFEQISEGSLSLDDTTVVSADAWKQWAGTEASLMFLGEGETVSVRDLLMGIVVSSGNDACTVAAQMLAGTEEAFALWMNEKARDLGMENSRFQNASGWPAPDQYTTAEDLAILAERTIRDFPDLYRFYAEKSFTYGKDFRTGTPISQSNRNPLLYRMDGADGLKTGHTRAAGYGLAASAEREGRRLIAVVSGLESVRERARESQSLLEYGFRAFSTYALFEAGETVADAAVWLGEAGTVPLLVSEPVKLTLSRRDRAAMTVTLAYDSPIPAPVVKGQPVATIEVTAPGIQTVRVPVVAGADVAQVSGFARIGEALEYMLFGEASGS